MPFQAKSPVVSLHPLENNPIAPIAVEIQIKLKW
jgi:hypothetical protein